MSIKSLFSVNLPPLPDNVNIHYIENTPLLKRVKNLYIFGFFFGIIGSLFIQFTLTKNLEDFENSLIISYVFYFLCILIYVFCFFILSKLSLRMALLKYYAIVIGISLAINVISFLFLDIDPQKMLNNPEYMFSSSFQTYMIVALVAFIIDCILMWKLCKEQSFILHQEGFFKGAKMIIWGIVILVIAVFIALLAFAIDLVALSIIALILLLLACILMIVGCVIYIIAMFKINLVIAYGEQTPNPL